MVRDLSLVKPKKTKIFKVTKLIKFSKQKKDWFCLYDDLYIRQYHNECVSKELHIALYRNLDSVFNPELQKAIIDCNDAQGFMFADLISMAIWQARMKELKNK